jgi:hypothetical protein
MKGATHEDDGHNIWKARSGYVDVCGHVAVWLLPGLCSSMYIQEPPTQSCVTCVTLGVIHG